MIIISAGMQKSGSAYKYNILNDLLVASGKSNARDVKESAGLESIMQWHNNNVGELDKDSLKKLRSASKKHGDFAVKTHSGPTRYLDYLLKWNKVKVIYIYRDPIDVLLSAIDHGKKILAEGEDHTFAGMTDFNEALKNVKQWITIQREYSSNKRVLSIKYEELMEDGVGTVKRICDYLKLELPEDQIKEILHRYDKDNPAGNFKGLHFNKAKTQRYREEMSAEQLRLVDVELGFDLDRMDYPRMQQNPD